MKHEGKIIISNGGKIRANVEGVEGPDCKGLLNWVEKLGEVKDRGPTPDMYKNEIPKIRQKVRGR